MLSSQRLFTTSFRGFPQISFRCYSQGGRKSKFPILTTLDPSRLRSSDHLDISSLVQATLLVPGKNLKKNDPPSRVIFRYWKQKSVQHLFPPRTSGFFYYHRPPSLHFAAGSIRFRVAAVNPATFVQGSDLLCPDGTPWEVTLPRLARSRLPLQQLLLRERLVTRAELQHCASLLPANRSRPLKTLVHQFHQPFLLSFETSQYIRVVAGGKAHLYDVRVFQEARNSSRNFHKNRPYSGSALVRFELSTLPQHAGQPTVVLRVVKMIEPPRVTIPGYDGYLPPPVEGELVMRPGRGHSVELHPWAKKLEGTPLALLAREVEPEKLEAATDSGKTN